MNKGQKWEGKQGEGRWGQQIARVLDAVRRPLLFLSEVENHWSFCTDAKDWYYQICLLAGPPYREQTARKYKQKRETQLEDFWNNPSARLWCLGLQYSWVGDEKRSEYGLLWKMAPHRSC